MQTNRPEESEASDATTSDVEKHAVVFRMVTDDHICPYGIKSVQLLEREGFVVDDRHLETREETDAFQEKHDVNTTPQTFINNKRIGGLDKLRNHFDVAAPQSDDGVTYAPIAAVFGVTALLAIALQWAIGLDALLTPRTLMLFGGLSMAVLAIQKLRDLEGFTNQFITYDFIGRREVRYAYAYPFLEAGAAVLLLGHVLVVPAAVVALSIGTVGALSVIKAVYVDKRDLKCACVGGDSNVPLGAISLSENIGMMAMGAWMLVQVVAGDVSALGPFM